MEYFYKFYPSKSSCPICNEQLSNTIFAKNVFIEYNSKIIPFTRVFICEKCLFLVLPRPGFALDCHNYYFVQFRDEKTFSEYISIFDSLGSRNEYIMDNGPSIADLFDDEYGDKLQVELPLPYEPLVNRQQLDRIINDRKNIHLDILEVIDKYNYTVDELISLGNGWIDEIKVPFLIKEDNSRSDCDIRSANNNVGEDKISLVYNKEVDWFLPCKNNKETMDGFYKRYSKFIKLLCLRHTKFLFATFYYLPLENRSSLFSILEYAKEEYDKSNSKDDLCKKYIDAISFFDITNLHKTVEEGINMLSFTPSDTMVSSFSEYPEIVSIFQHDMHFNKLKSKLLSFFNTAFNELAGIDSYSVKIVELAKEMRSFNKKRGLVGGAIGATMGTILFPGIGTIAGGAIAGYFSGKVNKTHNIKELFESIDNYCFCIDKFANYLGQNAKELYLFIYDIYYEYYFNTMNSFYQEITKIRKDADKLLTDYYLSELNKVEVEINTKLADDDETWKDVIERTNEFIKYYTKCKTM